MTFGQFAFNQKMQSLVSIANIFGCFTSDIFWSKTIHLKDICPAQDWKNLASQLGQIAEAQICKPNIMSAKCLSANLPLINIFKALRNFGSFPINAFCSKTIWLTDIWSIKCRKKIVSRLMTILVNLHIHKSVNQMIHWSNVFQPVCFWPKYTEPYFHSRHFYMFLSNIFCLKGICLSDIWSTKYRKKLSVH